MENNHLNQTRICARDELKSETADKAVFRANSYLRDAKVTIRHVFAELYGADQASWPQPAKAYYDFLMGNAPATIPPVLRPSFDPPAKRKKSKIRPPERLWTPSPDEVQRGIATKGAHTAQRLAEWGVSWPPLSGWPQFLRQKWEAEQAGNFELAKALVADFNQLQAEHQIIAAEHDRQGRQRSRAARRHK